MHSLVFLLSDPARDRHGDLGAFALGAPAGRQQTSGSRPCRASPAPIRWLRPGSCWQPFPAPASRSWRAFPRGSDYGKDLSAESAGAAVWFLLGLLGLLIGAVRQLAVLVMQTEDRPWTMGETVIQRGMLGIGVFGLFLLGIFPTGDRVHGQPAAAHVPAPEPVIERGSQGSKVKGRRSPDRWKV